MIEGCSWLSGVVVERSGQERLEWWPVVATRVAEKEEEEEKERGG